MTKALSDDAGAFTHVPPSRAKPVPGEDERKIEGLKGFALNPSLREIRRALKRHGLHIVTDADIDVLQACKEAKIFPGVPGLHNACIQDGSWKIAETELKRRGG
jgi:hypothetical protein